MARALPVEAWEKAEKIDGWFHRGEAEFLYGLVEGTWCEIGCWKGRSTTILAETGYPGYAVDWFKGSPEHDYGTNTLGEYQRNIAGYTNVTTIVGRFETVDAAVPDGLQLLFLDADHSYFATQRAFELYAPKVRPGGYVVLHDAKGDGWPGVEIFLAELLQQDDWLHAGWAERTVALRRA